MARPSYERAFGARAAEEGAALATRAPVDLRVNTLKATQPQVIEALGRFGAKEGPLSPMSVRIPAPGAGYTQRQCRGGARPWPGWYEVQDSGSQVAALLSGVEPRLHVADICAGAGARRWRSPP